MPKRTPIATGRPRIEPTDADVKKIERWAGNGHGVVSIARALGISHDLMNEWRKRHPAVNEALEAGRAKEHMLLLSKAMEKALKGDSIMLMFLLKTRHGYREGEQLQQLGSRVNITVNLPGALKPEQYTIEADERQPELERLPAPGA